MLIGYSFDPSDPPITQFTGEYSYLSNFYPAPIQWMNMLWPTSEHAYQAAKSTDKQVWTRIAKLKHPGQAKKQGRLITIRPDWDSIKYEVMYDIVYTKFTQHTELQHKLILTNESHIAEGNNHNDKIWGICNKTHTGTNWLGIILMQIRSELQKELKHEPNR